MLRLGIDVGLARQAWAGHSKLEAAIEAAYRLAAARFCVFVLVLVAEHMQHWCGWGVLAKARRPAATAKTNAKAKAKAKSRLGRFCARGGSARGRGQASVPSSYMPSSSFSRPSSMPPSSSWQGPSLHSSPEPASDDDDDDVPDLFVPAVGKKRRIEASEDTGSACSSCFKIPNNNDDLLADNPSKFREFPASVWICLDMVG